MATLSQNTSALRASNSQNTQTITRLEDRANDLDRQLALASAQERSAQATLRSAETRNRALREEMARLKASVAQIRSQCATDIRRRDGEISRLKRHLEGRRRRDGGSGQVGVVVVTPGLFKNGHANRGGCFDPDLDSPEYSLKQETTEFLTQLSQGLSDENDSLIGLVRGTLATLRSLQGLPADGDQGVKISVGLEASFDDDGIMIGPPSYEALATSTDEVLEHLRSLLTNPSFVPLEEVEVREEEIHRLREGWEMMAERWREAVTLMGGWQKRVVDQGDTIKLEDLQLGLELGSGLPSMQEARQSPFKLDTETGRSNGPRSHEALTSKTQERSLGAEEESINEAVDSQPLRGDRALAERDENTALLHQNDASKIHDKFMDNADHEQDDNSVYDCSINLSPKSPPKAKSRLPQVSKGHC